MADPANPEPAKPAEQSPAQRLAAEYDQTGLSEVEAPAGSPSPKATPPKDPATGRFVKPEPAPAAGAASPAPNTSPRLRRMAEDFGLSADEIDGMSSDALESVLMTMTRRLRSERVEQPWQSQPNPGRRPR